ncbi:MAG: DNA adenine methylase [Phycisphaeraceae bacterium]
MSAGNQTARPLKAPFPYFGGKRTVAAEAWARLGDVRNYVEPFAGSAAMLLMRPHAGRVETLNDADCFIANFWRATQAAPDEVVAYADGPVNEADLHARHRWLVLSDDAATWRERMRTDPDYYDPKVAGWWVWGQCMWIGGGWCSYAVGQDRRPVIDGGGGGAIQKGVHRTPHTKRPSLGDAHGGAGTKGVHQTRLTQQVPDISGEGGATGRGIHGSGMTFAGRPQLADAFSRGRGVHGHDEASTCAQRRAWLRDWFQALRDRLRPVRVCCGDWSRVCSSHSVTTRIGLTGIFLDPPYARDLDRLRAWIDALDAGRDAIETGGLFGGLGDMKGKASRSDGLYATDGQDVDRLVAEVHRYCRDRGGDPQMRIALCGYEGEHDALEEHGWTVWAWKAQGGYGNRGGENMNKGRERIWFSPHCLPVGGEETEPTS